MTPHVSLIPATPVPLHARSGSPSKPGGCGKKRQRKRHHESNIGNHYPWLSGADDKRRKRLPIECERESVVRKSGSGNLREPVVLLVENEPREGEAHGDQALRPRRAA
jgi:hypothetical protein